MASRFLTDDIRKKFYQEVIDHLTESERSVRALGENGNNPEALEHLGRHLHSVKGSAPIMGAKPISAVARALEDCVKAARNSPSGVAGPMLGMLSDGLALIRRQIGQFRNNEEMESGAEVIEAIKTSMPAGKLLDDILKHLESHSPELLRTIEETHRSKLNDSIGRRHHVYLLHLSLPESAYQAKLVEALKIIGGTGTAVAYALSSRKPREGFDEVMSVLVVSEQAGPDFLKRLTTLPVEIAEIGAEVRVFTESRGEPAAFGRKASAHAGRDPAQKRRILLVEDSDTTRELYRMVLTTNGFEVETAKDGVEALDRLRTGTYHAVLSDDQMPVMNGMELLRTMKSDANLKSLPVIIMSGNGSEEDRSNALATGAVRYFVKGAFEKAALVAELKEVAA